jgi:hypothetical protein
VLENAKLLEDEQSDRAVFHSVKLLEMDAMSWEE